MLYPVAEYFLSQVINHMILVVKYIDLLIRNIIK